MVTCSNQLVRPRHPLVSTRTISSNYSPPCRVRLSTARNRYRRTVHSTRTVSMLAESMTQTRTFSPWSKSTRGRLAGPSLLGMQTSGRVNKTSHRCPPIQLYSCPVVSLSRTRKFRCTLPPGRRSWQQASPSRPLGRWATPLPSLWISRSSSRPKPMSILRQQPNCL